MQSMRDPAEFSLAKYREKHGHVKLRVNFQYRPLSDSYKGLRENSMTIQLNSPSDLWKAVTRIQSLIVQIEEEQIYARGTQGNQEPQRPVELPPE